MTFNVYSWFLCITWGGWGGGGGGGDSQSYDIIGGGESGEIMSVFVNFLVICCLRKEPILKIYISCLLIYDK